MPARGEAAGSASGATEAVSGGTSAELGRIPAQAGAVQAETEAGVPQPGAAAAGTGPEAKRRELAVRLVLWRHGQTTWNAERRFQGQSDIPLDSIGEEQAKRAAGLLAALRPAAIFSSDLTRALSTAAPLARLTGLPVTPDKELRERYGGQWEGLTDVEIRTRYPAEHAQWMPPGGETTQAVADRARAALERIADSLDPGTLAVVVSHGAALRLGAARLLGFPEELWGTVGPLANCAWSVLGRRGTQWRLLEHNAGTLPEPVLSDDR